MRASKEGLAEPESTKKVCVEGRGIVHSSVVGKRLYGFTIPALGLFPRLSRLKDAGFNLLDGRRTPETYRRTEGHWIQLRNRHLSLICWPVHSSVVLGPGKPQAGE